MDPLRSLFQMDSVRQDPPGGGIEPPKPWEFELLADGAPELFSPEREAVWRERARQLALEKVILQRSLLEVVNALAQLKWEFERETWMRSAAALMTPGGNAHHTYQSTQQPQKYIGVFTPQNQLAAEFAKQYWSGRAGDLLGDMGKGEAVLVNPDGTVAGKIMGLKEP